MADQETPVFLKNILYQDEITGKIIRVFASLWSLFPGEPIPDREARAKVDEGVDGISRVQFSRGECLSPASWRYSNPENLVSLSRQRFRVSMPVGIHRREHFSRLNFARYYAEPTEIGCVFSNRSAGGLELSPSDVAFVRVVVDPDTMNEAEAAEGKLVHFEIGAGDSDCLFSSSESGGSVLCYAPSSRVLFIHS